MSEPIQPPMATDPNPAVSVGLSAPAERRRLLGRAFLKLLSESPAPMSDLKSLRGQMGEMADYLLRFRDPASRAGKLTEAGRETLTGVFVYWVGLATGLVFPPVGLLIGVLGSAGLAKGYKRLCETRRDFEFLRTFFSCLLLMEQADNKITDLERKQMDAFIESLPISEADRNELRKLRIKRIDDVVFPGWFEFSHARTILSGCWSLSSCDGIAAEEIAVFRAISGKLGVTPKELKSIQEEATQAVEAYEKRILRTALIAPLLWSGAHERRNDIVEILGSLSVRRFSGKEMLNSLAEMERDPVQQKTLIGDAKSEQAVLGSSLLLCKALADDDGARKAGEAFLEKARELKWEAGGREFLEIVDEVFARVG